MPVGAIIQLVMALWPLVLDAIKLAQDLSDGRYDGDGGANKLKKDCEGLLCKFQEEKKKSA